MAPRDTNNRGGWQVKRVNSATGPIVGTTMTDAIEEETSVTDQTEVLWKSDSLCLGSKCKGFYLTNKRISFYLLFARWLEGRGPIKILH